MKQRKQTGIRVDVVPSTDTIDLAAWLDRYAAAIVEANGSTSNATNAA